MKEITVGFSKPVKFFSPFSWAIRLYENTEYSHVYVKWSTSVGPEIIYQASKSSVNFVGNNLFKKAVNVVEEYKFILTDEEFKNLNIFCINNAGISYSITQILGITIAEIFRLKTNPFSNGSKAYVCSELVASIFKNVMGLSLGKNPDLVTPKDINHLCKMYGNRVQ